MPSVRVVQPRVSFADLQRLPEDGPRYELYDGEVFVIPAPNPRHQVVTSNVKRLLEHYSLEYGGISLFSPIDIVFSEHDVVHPGDHVDQPLGVELVEGEAGEAGVGDHHHLALPRRERGVGHQLAASQARAVDHRGRRDLRFAPVLDVAHADPGHPVGLAQEPDDLGRRPDDGAVVVKRATVTLPLGVLPEVSFFSVLRQKLKWTGSNL